MASGSSYKIKLSSGMRPYVGRVVRSGAVQKAFAEQIGKPAGACVRSGVRAGMSGAAIRNVVRQCGKATAGTRLNIAAHRSGSRGVAA
jgi:hypothetical protein